MVAEELQALQHIDWNDAARWGWACQVVSEPERSEVERDTGLLLWDNIVDRLAGPVACTLRDNMLSVDPVDKVMLVTRNDKKVWNKPT